MAKVIFEQILKQRGLESEIFADSAAKKYPSDVFANPKAKEAIKQLYGVDLLADHTPKSIGSLDLSDFDLILTMDNELKCNLPLEKTYTLKEYAGPKRGRSGRITDPWDKNLDTYIRCRDEIKDCLEKIVERILRDKHLQRAIRRPDD
jgi:protein-tyrosine-phosphatase